MYMYVYMCIYIYIYTYMCAAQLVARGGSGDGLAEVPYDTVD